MGEVIDLNSSSRSRNCCRKGNGTDVSRTSLASDVLSVIWEDLGLF